MGVAHGRVRPQQGLLFANPGAELLGTELFEFVPGTLGQRNGSFKCRNLCGTSSCSARRALNTSLAVDGHVTDVLQKLGGAISSGREFEQFWRFVNEPSCTVAGEESRVV